MRDGGIFQEVPGKPEWVRCGLCGKEMRNHALSRASHGKVHVRKGEAKETVDLSYYDGPRTVYVEVPS